MGAFRPRILAAAAKIETVSGTDSVPTLAANALSMVGIPRLNFGFLESGSREDVVFGQLGTIDRSGPAGRNGSIELTLEVRGKGAAYAAGNRPEADVLLRGAGMSSTVNAGAGTESVTYTTLDDGHETFTLYLWSAKKLYKMVGCSSNLRLNSTANARGSLVFSVQGKIIAAPATTALGAVTLSQVIPPLWHSATTSIGAWTIASPEPLVLTAMALDLGNTVTARPSSGATDGLISFGISDRKARIELDVEQVELATFDPYLMATQPGGPGATDNKVTTQIGTVQYNQMKILTGRIALEPPTHQEVNGFEGWKLQGLLVANTETVSNRELRLVFD